MRKTILAAVFLAFSYVLAAQQSLNNDEVIKLVKAGMSEDLIVSSINAAPGNYNTSADGLIALKSAGASDKVVSAIIQRAAAAASSALSPAGQSTPEATNNAAIVKLLQAGSSDDAILTAIYLSSGGYDTSPGGLAALKRAGASDKVISFVVLKAAAASSAPPPSLAQTKNNAAIVKLVQAGNSDDAILSIIAQASGSYDASPDGLAVLKQAGVSDSVIAAIVQKTGGPAQPDSSTLLATMAAQDPNDPMSLHKAGIYLMTSTPDGKAKMVLIKQADSGNPNLGIGSVLGMAFSYGMHKAKLTDQIPGAHAAIQTQDKSPVFYMYLPENGYIYDVSAAFMKAGTAAGASSTMGTPAQFSLMSMDDKKDHREIEVGKMGMWSGEKDAIDEKKAVKFNAEKIGPYTYKVTPAAALKPGEYAFVAATGLADDDPNVAVNWNDLMVGAVAVFDFGID
jgi:hypothetical protein